MQQKFSALLHSFQPRNADGSMIDGDFMRVADRFLVQSVRDPMGLVLAEDLLFARQRVVLKRPSVPFPAAPSWWLPLQCVTAAWETPAFARVLDLGMQASASGTGTGIFLARAYVPGQSLDRVFAETQSDRSAQHFRRVLARTVNVLRSLHDAGFAHGNLRPGNVLLDGATVTLTDPGPFHHETSTGTAERMPPTKEEDLRALCAFSRALLSSAGWSSKDGEAQERASLLSVLERGSGGERFESAEALLEALQVSPEKEQALGALPSGTYEAELGALLGFVSRRLLAREGGPAAVLVAGGVSSTRSLLLTELRFRARLRGVRCVQLSARGPDAWSRVACAAELFEGSTPTGSLTVEEATRAFRRASRSSPVLLVFDELERAEPSFVEQLRLLAYGVEGLDALLVVAAAQEESAGAAFCAGTVVHFDDGNGGKKASAPPAPFTSEEQQKELAQAELRWGAAEAQEKAGETAVAASTFELAARDFARLGLWERAARSWLRCAKQRIYLRAITQAKAELEPLRGEAERRGDRWVAGASALALGHCSLCERAWPAALEEFELAEHTFRSIEAQEEQWLARLGRAEVLLTRAAGGDAVEAAALLEGAPKDGYAGAVACWLEGRAKVARGEARAAQRILLSAIEYAEREHHWELLSRALSERAAAHVAVGAELHARKDREQALDVLENVSAGLSPALRGAFWSAPERAALRGAATSLPEPPAPKPIEERRMGSQFGVAGRASHFGSLVSAGLTGQDPRVVLLLELSRRVGEEATLERVLEQAVRAAVELTNAERGAVLLVSDAGSLEVRARSGGTLPGGDGPDESFSRSIAETVLIDGEPVATLNARGDRRFSEFRSVHDLAIGAVAAAPIKARGRALGVLYVENRLRRAFWTAADLALMTAFAEQAGIAVEHARVMEQLEARTRELEAAKRQIEGLLAERTEELETTKRSLQRAEEALKNRFAPQGMVAQTEAMRKVFAIIDRVRDSDVSVVIEGESGTGKEMVARSLHFSGVRAKGPFVVAHCGAIPESLLESELFGHVKGAFTGADRDRKGLLASAHGGTLMLDEVSEMPLKMQVELLRVLQDRKVRPVGSEREEFVDLRIVAATNRSLSEMVSDGKFREDLFYRLSVVTVRIPPLRSRLDDIPALASHFLARFAEEHGGNKKRLSREAMARLLRAPWPGNVRQLRHVLESAAVLAEGDSIEAEQLSLEEAPIPVAAATGASPLAVRKAAERQRIVDALEQTNWNKVRAAVVLGMPRRTLYRRLREYGLLDE